MSVSRKHFTYMATEFGTIFRDIDSRFVHGSPNHEIACDYVREAMFALEVMFKKENPQFQRDKFEDWVADVRYGRRDYTGRKVA